MKERYRIERILVITALIVFVGHFALAISADQIMEEVERSQSHQSSALDITLELIDQNGEVRTRRIQTLQKTSETRTESITIFLSPASVKQTRFLSIEEGNNREQWIYLPALRQSRKISSSEKDSSFMGSDFSYNDMNSTYVTYEDAKHTLLETTDKAYIIESLPLESKNSYGKTITHVDKDTHIPLLVQMFDDDRITMIKELKTLEKNLIDGEWIATKMEMRTISTGHKTIITIVQSKFDIAIPSAYFSLQFLQTGRI